ncbi:hypothetical protein DPMN_129152 [Dreissena polymorpha]|uniref:Uncharacterized protein n=1 Tax=Dreissena polymorpha TaxID=45954 RepID=A0A9D4H8I6_DREPO|nr:hypothetical protein DPMN_129152 [Dreissena polymorpha]
MWATPGQGAVSTWGSVCPAPVTDTLQTATQTMALAGTVSTILRETTVSCVLLVTMVTPPEEHVLTVRNVHVH